MMKRKSLGWGAAILAAYVLLLCALTAVEASNGKASIRSFSDALWYSLITLTTVGYGDMYPVTAAGRLIGSIMVLMSMGFLATVIGSMIALFTGRLLPGALLCAFRRKNWFLFSEYNEASQALALDLMHQYPNSLCVFGNAEKVRWQRNGFLFLQQQVASVLDYAGGKGSRRYLFLMNSDPLVNAAEGQKLQEFGAAVYCLGPENPTLRHLNYFDPFECCARRFWLDHPLNAAEHRVLIAGSGGYAQALLETAILSQSRQPFERCEYHLFGDWNHWRCLHPTIDQVLAVNENCDGRDTLYFHPQDWFCDFELLARADRVILCHENEKENLRDALVFNRLIGGRQALYVRTSQSAVPGECFGQADRLYTQELTMKHELDAAARRVHELYRSRYPDMPHWEELSPFLKASNRAAADHQPVKRKLLNGDQYGSLPSDRQEQMRRCEHERWMRFHSLYNWRWGEKKDEKLRLHPCMLPYEQLSASDRAKDDYAWQMLEESP